MRPAILSLLLLLPSVAPASVAWRPLDALLADAELVVLAEVTSLREEGGQVLAEARVERLLAGTATAGRLTFRASPAWTCDVSAAKAGERAVLLLRRSRADAPHELVHHGRGRFPISGDEVLVYGGGVTLPPELPRRLATEADAHTFPDVALVPNVSGPMAERVGFLIVKLPALVAFVELTRRAGSPRARSSR